VVTVDTASGSVTDATMVQSTGNNLLDQSTTSTFRRWKFRPGTTAPKVKIPITFTMAGASY
jgi:TonB family protein